AVPGPAFNASGAEGPILLPAGVQGAFPGGAISTATLTALTALTRDRHLALTALFSHAVLRTRVAVPQAQILRTEQAVVARVFHGSVAAYLAALAQRHVTRTIARLVIADELRRPLIAAAIPRRQTTLQWSADVEAAAADTVTCLRDDLPGTGDFPASNAREIGLVPVAAYL